MDALVRRLVDEAEIKAVHLRYCRGIDRMDWDLVRSCYHPDAIDDHGPFVGGIDDFIRWVEALLPSFESTSHFAGNQLVEVQGDVAWAEHYTRAYHRIPARAGACAAEWILNLRYVDRMERRDEGGWRIAHRVLACESERTDPIGAGVHLGTAWHQGRRDRSDLSYARA